MNDRRYYGGIYLPFARQKTDLSSHELLLHCWCGSQVMTVARASFLLPWQWIKKR